MNTIGMLDTVLLISTLVTPPRGELKRCRLHRKSIPRETLHRGDIRRIRWAARLLMPNTAARSPQGSVTKDEPLKIVADLIKSGKGASNILSGHHLGKGIQVVSDEEAICELF